MYEDAYNETSIELVAAAEAHCRVFLVETYYNAFSELTNISDELRAVLKQLMELYAVHTILRNVGDLLRVGTDSVTSLVTMQIFCIVHKCAWKGCGKFAAMVRGSTNGSKAKCSGTC